MCLPMPADGNPAFIQVELDLFRMAALYVMERTKQTLLAELAALLQQQDAEAGKGGSGQQGSMERVPSRGKALGGGTRGPSRLQSSASREDRVRESKPQVNAHHALKELVLMFEASKWQVLGLEAPHVCSRASAGRIAEGRASRRCNALETAASGSYRQ